MQGTGAESAEAAVQGLSCIAAVPHLDWITNRVNQSLSVVDSSLRSQGVYCGLHAPRCGPFDQAAVNRK